MNRKGIVFSGLIYALLVFFLLLIISILMVLWYRQNAINSLGKDANNIYDELQLPFTTDFDYKKGVNVPKLATGMTPIKWDGTTWIITTEEDEEWYDYKNKQWANVQTADGSMWVWIPRYGYQIATNYHTSTAGTINVKFLIDDTDTTADGTTISDMPTYSGSSQTNYIAHPAFTFGTVEITGMWVAKFELSGTVDALDSKPGITYIKMVTVGDMFTHSRNMEINSRYGWGTSGNNIDTHMMKNIEWGAVAYLSQSAYGKNAEITINTSASGYTGGGAGNAYATTNTGQSTTGNVYGIYDISGGAWEYVAAYVNNGHNNLMTHGSSIINADEKYKDIYEKSTEETSAGNYDLTIDKKGDAVYETSGETEDAASWYSDDAIMPVASNAWFSRGGGISQSFYAGAFCFSLITGGAGNTGSWRIILLVESGL